VFLRNGSSLHAINLFWHRQEIPADIEEPYRPHPRWQSTAYGCVHPAVPIAIRNPHPVITKQHQRADNELIAQRTLPAHESIPFQLRKRPSQQPNQMPIIRPTRAGRPALTAISLCQDHEISKPSQPRHHASPAEATTAPRRKTREIPSHGCGSSDFSIGPAARMNKPQGIRPK